ncbi:MAG: hypothetical protein QM780_10610 [Hyphomicrobium sp.]|uniref:hypothetical protein n=1 Tax=Hyphomicrobium sp. TaxID=82 RepID=UPI0039E628E4
MTISGISGYSTSDILALFKQLREKNSVDATQSDAVDQSSSDSTQSTSTDQTAAAIDVSSSIRNSVISMMMGAGIGMGPPPPPPPSDSGNSGGSLDSELSTLLSSVESGDTDSAQSAATALEKMLESAGISVSDDSDSSSTSSSTSTDASQSTDSDSMLAEFKSLLASVSSGDMDSAKSTVDSMMSAMNSNSEISGSRPDGPPPGGMGGPGGPGGPPPGQSGSDTVASSLQSALDTLKSMTSSDDDTSSSDSSSDTSSSTTAFIDSLKNLFETMELGGDVDGQLRAVIAAYSANSSQAS